MSDEDQSGDNKGFLARWSQRKREAKQPDRDVATDGADVPAMPVAESEAVPEFDLSSLPKLEDMTASTDITAFLRRGVPEHLRNAALRKSWALDPAIRNYVNPALEYAYDWNTLGGVPGSSEIGAGMDVARMVLQIMGSGESAVEPPVASADSRQEPASDPSQSSGRDAGHESKPDLPTEALRLTDERISAAQEPSSSDERAGMEAGQTTSPEESNSAEPQQAVRRHGSAKPLV
ncbi:MAG TPA: DUF3306 domain-containing protein [Bradyrhizobium sp.]|jgi:hypothetical protein